MDETWMSEDGEVLTVVAFTDEDMFEVPEEFAHFAIAERGDGSLEAVEIIAKPTAH